MNVKEDLFRERNLQMKLQQLAQQKPALVEQLQNLFDNLMGCRLRMMSRDPTEQEKEKIISQEEIWVIGSNGGYSVVFHGKSNECEIQFISDDDLKHNLDKLLDRSIITNSEIKSSVYEIITSHGGTTHLAQQNPLVFEDSLSLSSKNSDKFIASIQNAIDQLKTIHPLAEDLYEEFDDEVEEITNCLEQLTTLTDQIEQQNTLFNGITNIYQEQKFNNTAYTLFQEAIQIQNTLFRLLFNLVDNRPDSTENASASEQLTRIDNSFKQLNANLNLSPVQLGRKSSDSDSQEEEDRKLAQQLQDEEQAALTEHQQAVDPLAAQQQADDEEFARAVQYSLQPDGSSPNSNYSPASTVDDDASIALVRQLQAQEEGQYNAPSPSHSPREIADQASIMLAIQLQAENDQQAHSTRHSPRVNQDDESLLLAMRLQDEENQRQQSRQQAVRSRDAGLDERRQAPQRPQAPARPQQQANNNPSRRNTYFRQGFWRLWDGNQSAENTDQQQNSLNP